MDVVGVQITRLQIMQLSETCFFPVIELQNKHKIRTVDSV
jgi:hypothetical protein